MVLVRRDGAKPPLSPAYEGPYRVLERSDRYFRLQVGDRTDSVSVERLKPAVCDSAVQPALPRRRGRPRKSPPSPAVPPALPRPRGRPRKSAPPPADPPALRRPRGRPPRPPTSAPSAQSSSGPPPPSVRSLRPALVQLGEVPRYLPTRRVRFQFPAVEIPVQPPPPSPTSSAPSPPSWGGVVWRP